MRILIPIGDDSALDALANWLYLLYNSTDVQPLTEGPLFTRILKGGRITMEKLSDQGVYHILDTRRQQANMAPFTPHDLRRAFAGDLLDTGVDLSTVQKLMGHANANTTTGYDRRGERAKRDVVRKLHVPFAWLIVALCKGLAPAIHRFCYGIRNGIRRLSIPNDVYSLDVRL